MTVSHSHLARVEETHACGSEDEDWDHVGHPDIDDQAGSSSSKQLLVWFRTC